MRRTWVWMGGCLALALGVVMAMPVAGQTTGPGGTAGATTRWSTTIPAREAARKNPIAAGPGPVATGKQIYAANCAACHGAAGKGNGTVAGLQDLPPADLTNAKYRKDSDGTLSWRISNGHRPMPKFDGNLLPDESRWNVVIFLRTLSGPAATGPASAPAGG